MLTREDLQAIADIMDEKIQASEQRTDEKLQAMEQRIATNTAQFVREEIQAAEQRTDEKLQAMERHLDKKLQESEQRIMQGAAALMDAEFTKHFKLLSEQQDRVLSGLADEDDLSIIDGRLDDLETTVKRHSAEIAKLKKAQ